jgi:hypothetical protein
MTAKEALHEKVEGLSEDEAAELLARLEWEATETEDLTDEELAEVLEGERQLAAGDSVSGKELFARLGL